MQTLPGQIAPINPNVLINDISVTIIIVNIMAGLIGTIYLMYGKKTLNIPMIICGILLCIVPYVINNTQILIIACLLMLAAPYLISRYV